MSSSIISFPFFIIKAILLILHYESFLQSCIVFPELVKSFAQSSYIVWNTILCLFFFLICLYLLCYRALQIQVLIYSGWNYFYINLQGTKCLLSEISVGIAGRCCGNPRYSFLWSHRQRALYYSWLWWPMGGMASISVRHLCYYS